MRLSSKHGSRQKSVIRADFSGGLNTTTNIDGIGEKQLGECMNMEADHSTGRLKTVAGTVDLIKFSDKKIFAGMYDEINKVILLVMEDKSLRIVDPTKQTADSTNYVSIAEKINGNLYPITAAWENGILISSGEELQYFEGTVLKTIEESPKSSSVYVRAGRVVVTDEKNVRYSGVGDETQWAEDTNDDSTSKFLEVGYKDGGEVIGFLSLSQDLLIVKDNRHVYRLAGEFPQWSLNEVSRNVECSGRLSFCAVADRVFILGKSELQSLQTVEQYGAVKPANVGTLVQRELQELPKNAIVRFIPPLQQLWIIGRQGLVLMFDLVFNSWYKRKFNSEVIDVLAVGNEVYIIKKDRISRLDENIFYDDGEPLQWKFTAQRLISQYDYLLKRTQVSVIPISRELYSGYVSVGAVKVPLPIPNQNIEMTGNQSAIYKNHTKLPLAERQKYVYTKGEPLYDDVTQMYNNNTPIFSRQTYIKESRNVYRSKFLSIAGQGSAGGFLLNGIVFDVVEV